MAIGDRIPGRDFDFHSDNDLAEGIGVDSTYAYITDRGRDKIFVYRLSDGARQTSREFNLNHADNHAPFGISVDATYAYIVEFEGTKVHVYRLSDGVRQISREFNLHPDQHRIQGLGVDSIYAYVADRGSAIHKIFVYRLSDGVQQTSREFNLHADNNNATGISVDSTYAYVVQRGDQFSEGYVFVYRLSDGVRQTSREFPTSPTSPIPTGISVDSAYAYISERNTGAGLIPSPSAVRVFSILPSEAAPGPPAAPVLTPGITQIDVAWFAPSSTGTSPITAYDIRHKRSVGGSYTTIHDAWTAGGLTHSISMLEGGISYDVQVRAVNDAGDGEWSPIATATAIAPAASAPGEPDAPTVTIVGMTFQIEWLEPSNSGAVITRYEHRSRRSGGAWTHSTAWQTGGGPLSSTVQFLDEQRGLTYEWQIRAENSAGSSLWSASTFIDVPGGLPGAPTISSITPSIRQLTVVWSPPSSTGGAPITNYDVRHKIGNGGYTTISPATNGGLTYTILNLVGGTTYSVEVRAVNSAGDGPWSTEDMGTTPATVPGEPAAPALSDTSTSVTATWDAPAITGGEAISSYDIRHRRGSNAWITLQSIWSSGARSYSITGLSPNVAYEVQVRAVNLVGAGGWSGMTSRTTGSTTPGQPEIVALTPGDQGLVAQWLPPTSDGGTSIVNYDVRWRTI